MLKEISVSRQYAPLRVCADICFYFFTVSLFSFSLQYFSLDDGGVLGVVSNLIVPWSLPLSLFTAACFALGFLIIRLDSAALRFLLSLLPGLCFLMGPFSLYLLIHTAAWAYYVVVMTIGSFEVHLDEYRRRIRLMLAAALLFTLCLIIFHFATEAWYYNRLFGGEAYGLFFFALSVLSLRGMRTELGAPKLMRLLDAAYVVALPTLLVAVFLLLTGTVPAITFLFRQLTRFLIWLYHVFFPKKVIPYQFRPPLGDDLNGVKTEKSLFFPDRELQTPDAEMTGGKGLRALLPSETTLWLTIILLAALLVYIAILLLRRRERDPRRPRIVREHVEKPPFEGLLRRSFGDPSEPAGVRQIRRIYRSYLHLIRSLRMRLDPSDTSQDVLAYASSCLDMPENAALRELYIAARYGDPRSVTARQAAEAKRCLAAIEAASKSLPDRS